MKENILVKLAEMRDKLNELRKLHHSKGKDDFYYIMNLLDRIVDRTYPEKDAKSVKNKYHRIAFFGGRIPDEEEQKDFIYDIDGTIKAIDLIIEEYNLLGFDDFKPIKEKTQTEFGINKGKLSWFKRWIKR